MFVTVNSLSGEVVFCKTYKDFQKMVTVYRYNTKECIHNIYELGNFFNYITVEDKVKKQLNNFLKKFFSSKYVLVGSYYDNSGNYTPPVTIDNMLSKEKQKDFIKIIKSTKKQNSFYLVHAIYITESLNNFYSFSIGGTWWDKENPSCIKATSYINRISTIDNFLKNN